MVSSVDLLFPKLDKTIPLWMKKTHTRMMIEPNNYIKSETLNYVFKILKG